MTIRLLTLGIARDITGGSSLTLDVPDATTVAGLKSHLLTLYPRFESLDSLFIAVNAEYGEAETRLTEQDEIALIPPVSGG